MKQLIQQTGLGILLLLIVCLVSHHAGLLVPVHKEDADSKAQKPVVVIDVGHGGFDPGKVGIDGQLEKDINLAVAKRLRAYLEASDVEVVMTRESDKGLNESGDSKKKMADMRKRCERIKEVQPSLVVSIHQNSYHQEEVNGGQVFYYKGSQKGKQLAEILQKRFDYVLGENNRRSAKANSSYYLLLHVKEPIVIVECGFLSNRKEAGKLDDPEYQDRLAWTIHVGIMEYLNTDRSQSGKDPSARPAADALQEN